MDLIWLNEPSGAARVEMEYADWVTRLFAQPVAAQFGVAYGGCCQRVGRLFQHYAGTVHGFDTFSGHPRHLAPSPDTMEATCMDMWYNTYGTDALSIEFQQDAMNQEGLSNVFLHKGLIDEHSLDGVPVLHYALLDMDLVASMRTAWNLVRPRMAPGGFLLLHDVVPPCHIEGLYDLYREIVSTGEYDEAFESHRSYLAVLRRRVT